MLPPPAPPIFTRERGGGEAGRLARDNMTRVRQRFVRVSSTPTPTALKKVARDGVNVKIVGLDRS